MSHSRQLKADLLLTAPAPGGLTLFLGNCSVAALMAAVAVMGSSETVTKEVVRGGGGGEEEKSQPVLARVIELENEPFLGVSK